MSEFSAFSASTGVSNSLDGSDVSSGINAVELRKLRGLNATYELRPSPSDRHIHHVSSFEGPTLQEVIKKILKNKSPIKTTKDEDRRLRKLDCLICFLAVSGVIIMVAQLLAFWSYETGMRTDGAVQGVKFLNIAVTGALYVVMYAQAVLSKKMKARQWKSYSRKLKFRLNVFFWLKTFFKVISCLVQPIPFVNRDNIGVFMFLRIWTVIPVIRDFHPIFTCRREIVSNPRFAVTSSETTFSSGTCVRALFYKFPLISTLSTVFTSFAISSFLVNVLERDYHDPHSTNISYIYMSLITLTTVGYGDYAPTSQAGRAACVLTGFTGIIMTAFLINCITSYMQLSPLQKEAADWTMDRHHSKSQRHLAALLIQRSYRYYIRMRAAKFPTVQIRLKVRDDFRAAAKKLIKKLRHIRRKMQITKVHSEDPVLDKVLQYQVNFSNLEMQNRILQAKVDALSDMFLQIHSNSLASSNPIPVPPANLPAN